MKVLAEGPTKVLEYKKIVLLEREPAAGYQEEKPTRFEARQARFFVMTANSPAMEFKNKRSIEEIFPDKVEILEKFAKTNKLKFKDINDVISVCKYYDGLEP